MYNVDPLILEADRVRFMANLRKQIIVKLDYTLSRYANSMKAVDEYVVWVAEHLGIEKGDEYNAKENAKKIMDFIANDTGNPNRPKTWGVKFEISMINKITKTSVCSDGKILTLAKCNECDKIHIVDYIESEFVKKAMEKFHGKFKEFMNDSDTVTGLELLFREVADKFIEQFIGKEEEEEEEEEEE